MFLPNRQRVPGVLVGDLLAISRGETLTKRRPRDPQPHHVTCVACGYERWDGQSQHPQGGKRFARACYGPTKDQRDRAEGTAVAAPPMVAELLELAGVTGDVHDVPVAAPVRPAAPGPHFRALGTVPGR